MLSRAEPILRISGDATGFCRWSRPSLLNATTGEEKLVQYAALSHTHLVGFVRDRMPRTKFMATRRAWPATSSNLFFLLFTTKIERFLVEIVEAVDAEEVEEEDDGSADTALEQVWSLAAGPSNCQAIPCCSFMCAKLSRRSWMSSFVSLDLRVFSG